MKKRLPALLLTMVMALVILPVHVFALTARTLDTPGVEFRTENSITLKTAVPSAGGGTVSYLKFDSAANQSGDWQESVKFEGLTANTGYYFQAKAASDGTYDEALSPEPTSDPTKAYFTAKNARTIAAPAEESKTDTTVKLTVPAVTPEEAATGYGTVQYGYSADANTVPTNWQDSTEFTGLAANTAYYFWAQIKDNSPLSTAVEYADARSAPAEITTNKTPGEISAPTAASKTDTSVTLNAVSATTGDGAVKYGYSINSSELPAEWQDGLEFTGLNPNTTYYFWAKVEEGINYGGAVSASSTSETTNLGERSIAAPPVSASTDSTVDLEPVEPSAGSGDGAVKYGWSSDASQVPADWQESTSFTGLTADTVYYFWAKAEAGTNYKEAVSVSGTEIRTGKKDSAINAPGIAGKTDTTVTLTAVSPTTGDGAVRYGYSTDPSAQPSGWQEGVEFTGLNPNTTYYFWAKVEAGTAFNEAVSPSGTEVKTNKSAVTIAAPTAAESTYNSVTLNAVTPSAGDGAVKYGYSTDPSAKPASWQAETAFTGLAPNTTYYFWSKAEEGTHHLEAVSEAGTEVKTPVAARTIPAPTVKSRTDTTITLNTVTPSAGDGKVLYACSSNGYVWQESPEFTGLNPGTTYSFYAGIAATGEYESAMSEKADFATDRGNAPADKPVIVNTTDTSIEVKAVGGYSFAISKTNSKDNLSWQNGANFTGLEKETQYYVFAKRSQNDQFNEAVSDGVSVFTDASTAENKVNFDGGKFSSGTKIKFTVTAAGNGKAVTGMTRYVPVSWSTNPSGTFTLVDGKYTAEIDTKDMSVGKHTLTVTFEQEKFDGTNWVKTGKTDVKTVDYELTAAKTDSPKTGDSNVGLIIGIVICIIAAGAIVALVIYRKKKQQQ